MSGKNKNRQKTTRTSLGVKARKLILGLGLLGTAGITMAAAPALAREDHDRGRDVEHHAVDRRDVEHHDFNQRDFDQARQIRVWVPARYEARTYIEHGCPVTTQVCVEAGHWDLR